MFVADRYRIQIVIKTTVTSYRFYDFEFIDHRSRFIEINIYHEYHSNFKTLSSLICQFSPVISTLICRIAKLKILRRKSYLNGVSPQVITVYGNRMISQNAYIFNIVYEYFAHPYW